MTNDGIYSKSGKQDFIMDLCDRLSAALLQLVPRMPDEWDGVEIRWFIRRVVDRDFVFNRNKQSRRWREFQNYLNTHPL